METKIVLVFDDKSLLLLLLLLLLFGVSLEFLSASIFFGRETEKNAQFLSLRADLHSQYDDEGFFRCVHRDLFIRV